jgi:GNAT superfamily N-acetyltransferase
MGSGIKITNMKDLDIDEAKKIWNNQYELYCSSSDFPTYWKEDNSMIESFLKMKINRQSAIVAKLDDRVVGFLAYDEFPFHGESSVFCPAIGHAAIEEYKESIYTELYRSISEKWINKNIFNHMWTIFFNDEKLKTILFDLGYGSYLIDAFSSCDKEYNVESICDIQKATTKNIDALFELVNESNQYYASAPLFLKRDEVTYKELEELIIKNNVYMAWYKDSPVGFFNLSISENNNFIDMSVKKCGLIDEIGTYIKLEYRNKKIGMAMLKFANNYCREISAQCIHVDFETANLYGNKFWRKYFTPMLLSMRRTINKDING